MKTVSLIPALLWSTGFLPAQTRRNYTVDLGNSNAGVGALLIVAGPNSFGIPEGVIGFCSGGLLPSRMSYPVIRSGNRPI